MKKYILFIALFALITSCKKHKVVELPQTNSPIFKAEGLINGQPVSIIAGENDFEMISLINQFNGIDLAGGLLTNGKEELEFYFLDEAIFDPNHSFDVNNTNNLYYAYVPKDSAFANLNSSLFSNIQDLQSLSYYVNGEFAGNQLASVNKPGLFNIEAKLVFQDGETLSVENPLLLGFNEAETVIDAQLTSGSSQLSANLIVTGATATAVNWYLDGSLLSSSLTFTRVITEGRHILKADYTLSDGTKRQKSILIKTNYPGYASNDFNSAKTNIANNTQLDLKAVVTYRKDGKVYTSKTVYNNSLTGFAINDLQYYGIDGGGHAILKGNVEIICDLEENVSLEIIPVNLNCTFAFRIP